VVPWVAGPPPPRPQAAGVSVPGTQASFGARAAGFLIDSLVVQVVVGVVNLVAFLILFVGFVAQARAQVAFGGAMLLFAGLIVGTIGLQIGYETLAGRARGQTYGKHVARTVVVDVRSGLPGIGPGRAAVRWLARWLGGSLFGLGYLWMLWDPNQRTLHDLMTGTTVVHGPSEPTRSPVAYLQQLDVVPGTSPPPS
jgi:uncharacterized RDD family membrane protein YckC